EDYDWKGCIGLMVGGRFRSFSLTIALPLLICFQPSILSLFKSSVSGQLIAAFSYPSYPFSLAE
ncbi:hypothetical protein OFB51_24705, partial [Escherichia coli]|nr:hypothetical protein [Escherichia coli]